METLILGLILMPQAALCTPPQELTCAPGRCPKYSLELYEKQKTAYDTCMLPTKDALCQAEFLERTGKKSRNGYAAFSEKGKEYRKSTLTCEVKCDVGAYRTKGGTCKKHGR